jgi:glycine cleavage system H protein
MVDTGKLLFAKTHEWLRVEGNIGYVGITDHAQKEITDVVFVELPKVGKEVSKEGEAAVVESVKAAFSIYAPVSGKVIKANDAVEKDPSIVNKSPYDDGWFFAIEMKDPEEAASLMSLKDYEEFIKSGAH